MHNNRHTQGIKPLLWFVHNIGFEIEGSRPSRQRGTWQNKDKLAIDLQMENY
jgi:hypothetical protein